MNPFTQTPRPIDEFTRNWQELYPKSYAKMDINPFTRLRVILMNGTEFEATFFSHQFQRNCPSNDLRRALAETRRQEQQQQKTISCLKPIDENVLEHTIGYEQLAVELTAILAQREPDPYVKAALDFALLEDFDHLYRYADLMDLEGSGKAELYVGGYTEIMPGRPTIAHHRHPFDSVRRFTNFMQAHPLTKLDVSIITAAEQQTMNYYMNNACFYTSDLGRNLYQEIAQVEEQHVTHYGSLLDPNRTWLENLLLHEYTECYLYYSCSQDECDPTVKPLWDYFYEMEVAHLHQAAQLLQQYEGKDWQQVIPNGEFPLLLAFKGNKDYVRQVLQNTVENTAYCEQYLPVQNLPADSRFSQYQLKVNPTPGVEPGHLVIQADIQQNAQDYRCEDSPNPIPALRDRTQDNTSVGRPSQLR